MSPRFDSQREQLDRRSPVGRWEVITVTFTAANTDKVITHKLPAPKPEQIDYEVLRSNSPCTVYHDGGATRRAWGQGFIVLRCNQAPVTVDIRLSVSAERAQTRVPPPGPAITAAGDADTLDGLDSTAFALASHTHSAADITSGTLALARGGTGASLADPGADRILFWDDSGNQVDFLTAGTGLSISGTTLSTTHGIVSVSASLTDAQIKALPTTAITLVAAPAAGKRIKLLGASLRANTAAGAYTNINATYAALALHYLGDFTQWAATGIVDDVSVPITTLTNFLGTASTTYADLAPYLDALGGGWTTPNIFGASTSDAIALAIKADNNGSGNFTGGNAANALRVDLVYVVIG